MAYTTIPKSTDYFNTKLYTQTGSSNNGNTQTITMDNANFVWIKNRSYTNGHCLFDVLRGGDKNLATNGSGAQETVGGGLTFGSSDTTIGADTGGYGFNNRTGDNYVAWHWKGGGSGSSNTDGSITSTVSASSTSGFSIVKWTHTTSGNYTVGHGLNATPKMIIVKTTNATTNWGVYHSGLTVGKRVILNTTSAETTGYWGANSWTNNTFSIGSGRDDNGKTMIAYCFADVQGFSKFGSYTANASTNGPFVYTGFKPSFIMLKNVSTAQDWQMYTFDMQPFNEFCTTSAGRLKANTSDTQSTKSAFDMLSNGFKMRTNASDINGSGNQIIYMAFASEPLVSTNGVPATAR